jgi:hypothetical protein
MKIELIEETSVSSGTMYCVRVDDLAIKWFVRKEEAEKFYEEILSNPDMLKPQRNILKSEEINVPLEETNQ